MTIAPDLVHYPDSRPGIARKRCGRGFTYLAPDGTRIDDRGERRRIEALAVPPAYSAVWICPLPNGHLQATGRDDRDRKQYRYHPDWTAFRAQTKFDDLAAFGETLPAIRRAIRRDLSEDVGSHPFAVAAVLAMIDRLSMRVGNEDYADENGTYGATTLLGRHLKLADDGMRLSYLSKGGKRVRRQITDRMLQRVLERLDDLPGAQLVTWVDDGNTARSVTSSDVNARLAEITGDSRLTAKTFRTWNGSVAALDEAVKADGRVTIKAMAEAAADRLGNTPAIARKSYIHPDVIALSEDRTPLRRSPSEKRGLRLPERQLLDLIA